MEVNVRYIGDVNNAPAWLQKALNKIAEVQFPHLHAVVDSAIAPTCLLATELAVSRMLAVENWMRFDALVLDMNYHQDSTIPKDDAMFGGLRRVYDAILRDLRTAANNGGVEMNLPLPWGDTSHVYIATIWLDMHADPRRNQTLAEAAARGIPSLNVCNGAGGVDGFKKLATKILEDFHARQA